MLWDSFWDKYNQMSGGLIWWSKEVKCVIDIWAGESFPRCWTQQVKFIKVRGYECSVVKVWTVQPRVTSYLWAPVARQNISMLAVPVVGSVVFLLQTNCSKENQIKPRPTFRDDLGSAVSHQSTTAVSHIAKRA